MSTPTEGSASTWTAISTWTCPPWRNDRPPWLIPMALVLYFAAGDTNPSARPSPRAGSRVGPGARRREVGEVVVGDDLMSAIGQALVERSLGDEVSSHHPSFEEATLGSNPSAHADLRGSGELRRCN